MDGIVGTIVWGLLTGIVVGPLARLVLPGKQNISLLITILLGAVGAIVGDLIYSVLGGAEDTAGVDWIQWIVRIGVAAIAVILYGMTARGKSTAT